MFSPRKYSERYRNAIADFISRAMGYTGYVISDVNILLVAKVIQILSKPFTTLCKILIASKLLKMAYKLAMNGRVERYRFASAMPWLYRVEEHKSWDMYMSSRWRIIEIRRLMIELEPPLTVPLFFKSYLQTQCSTDTTVLPPAGSEMQFRLPSHNIHSLLYELWKRTLMDWTYSNVKVMQETFWEIC